MVIGIEKLEVTNEKQSILYDWFEDRIWLSVVGPELDAEAERKKKIREASSHCPNPGCCGLIAAKVVCWFPVGNWLAAAEFVGQNSILYTICLYISTLSSLMVTNNSTHLLSFMVSLDQKF